jgi:hypothetical protein
VLHSSGLAASLFFLTASFFDILTALSWLMVVHILSHSVGRRSPILFHQQTIRRKSYFLWSLSFFLRTNHLIDCLVDYRNPAGTAIALFPLWHVPTASRVQLSRDRPFFLWIDSGLLQSQRLVCCSYLPRLRCRIRRQCDNPSPGHWRV